ncbi:MAG: S8 family peptidase [Actinomycetota bacterium]|nr:S8 family peptidase [Actinomycetota bacterium]
MKTTIAIIATVIVIGLTTQARAAPAERIRVDRSLRHAPGPEVAGDHLIVKFKPGVTKATKDAVSRRFGASFDRKLPSANFELVLKAPGKTINEMVSEFKAAPEVAYAEPDHIMSALMVPNDLYYHYQWHLSNSVYGGINIEPAWDRATGANVIVAVVDTGIAYEDYSAVGKDYYKAPDLANTSFTPGYDFVNNDAHANDDESHGTHVAGTIAQSTNNSLGVAGIAFGATLMPVKVLDKNGSGTDSGVAAGIRYAADHGAKIINLSLGGGGSTTLSDAVVYAYNKGVTIIAAAGNDGGPVIYPAAYDQVIAVAATRYDEATAWYSNFGPQVDIAAPGGDTGVDQNDDGYVDGVLQQTFDPHNRSSFAYYYYQGTSMATPHVVGVAALLLSQDPSMTPSDIKNRLQSTAKDKGAPGWDQYYGWGIVNADAAVLPASFELSVSAIDLQTVAAGANSWPGDDAKNRPATINATVPWKLTVIAQSDFTGGGQSLASSNLKMGPSYAQAVGVSTTSTIDAASGGGGHNLRPDLSTSLNIPWSDGLANKALSSTFTYTVLPQ